MRLDSNKNHVAFMCHFDIVVCGGNAERLQKQIAYIQQLNKPSYAVRECPRHALASWR